MTTMKKKYVEEVAPALMKKFQYKSVMQIPRIDKIVVSVGCGDCKDNNKALEEAVDILIEKLDRHSPVLGWLLDYIEERIEDDKKLLLESAFHGGEN